jgi:HEAT repeat protein
VATPVDDTDGLRRLRAAKDEGDVAALKEGLRDPDNRHIAAAWLAELQAREAAPEIARLLDAANPLARSSAARSIGLLGCTDWLPRLLELAADDAVPYVRGTAVTAVARLGGANVLPLLIGYLSDDEWRVRIGAAFGCGLIGDPRAVDPIRRARRREGLRIMRRRAYSDALRKLDQR